MPLTRSQKRKSRQAMMKGPTKRGPTVKSLARKVKQIQREQELNHKDVFVDTTIDDLGTLTILNSLNVGDSTEGGVLNKSCIGTSLQFRAFIDMSEEANVGSPQGIRHIIFFDKQSNGTILTAATAIPLLFDNDIITNNLIAPYRMSTQKRFKIIYDKTYSMFAQEIVATVPTGSSKYAKKKRNFHRTIMYQDEDTIVDGTPETNALYSLWISDVGNVSFNGMPINCGYRFIYKDPQ